MHLAAPPFHQSFDSIMIVDNVMVSERTISMYTKCSKRDNNKYINMQSTDKYDSRVEYNFDLDFII